MNTITIDCGASFIKGAVFENNNVVKTIQKKSPTANKNSDITKPYQINSLLSLFFETLEELSLNLDSFILCVSNEMHGFIIADEEMNPVTDYVSWQKEFGNLVVDGVSSNDYLKASQKENILRTGMPLRSGLPSVNLCYLIRNKILDRSNLYFFTLGDYLIARLSRLIPNCHPTNAAATGLYDLLNNCWNEQLIKCICEEKNIIFPKIGHKVLTFKYNGKDVACYPAIGDQQAALLGSSFLHSDELSFNLGTGAQVSVLIEQKENVAFSDSYQIRPYFFGKYIKTIPHIPSGRAANVFVRFFESVINKFGYDVSEEDVWDRILSSQGDGSLEMSLSFFENAVDNNKVGYIGSIEESSLTFDEVSVSLLKQMAVNYINVSKRITTKGDVKKIVFSGGISRRIKAIRELILKEYPVDYYVAENETLTGLYKYSLIEQANI